MDLKDFLFFSFAFDYYLLFLNGLFVPSDGAEGLQLHLLLSGPIGQLAQRDEKGVPVVGIVLETIPAKEKRRKMKRKKDKEPL